MDDLISRETMKDAIDSTTWYHQNRNKDMVEGAYDAETAWFKAEDVYKAIENVPTVQPNDTPTATYRFGKWIEKECDGYHGGGYTECSVCGQRYSWGGYFEANGFRYCPRCGHRMEVVE